MTRRFSVLLAVPILLIACDGGDDGPAPGEPGADSRDTTLSREAFVSVYVDLRMAALRDPETELPPPERERILADHGVTSEELLRFVEVQSRDDPRAMQEIWAEVQDRIRQAREEAGTGGPSDAPSSGTPGGGSAGTDDEGPGDGGDQEPDA